MTTERTFDWRPRFDPRSLNFPIRTVTPEVLRSYTWSCGVHLDQGQEGACVGFAWSHDIAARPKVHTVTYQDAEAVYNRAKQIDEWPGESYEGTSVLAGAKAVQELHLLGEYRWAFSMNDVALAVGHHGPAVLGIWWYEGMWDPDDAGLVHATGEKVGGHAILCNGVNVTRRLFRLHNSWGNQWGRNGDCYVSFEDMDRLLNDEGEACVPVVRY
jgi:hypothetical protein